MYKLGGSQVTERSIDSFISPQINTLRRNVLYQMLINGKEK